MKKKGYSMFGRTIAFILLVLSLISIPVGAVGTYWMASEGFYIANAKALKDKYLDEYFYDLGKELLYSYHSYGEKRTTGKLENTCIHYRITAPDGTKVGNAVLEENQVYEWKRTYRYAGNELRVYNFENAEQYTIQMLVPVQKNHPDYVALICFLANIAGLLKVLLPGLVVGGFIIAVSSFVYLMCAAGWSRRKGKQTGGIFGVIPTDIFAVLVILLSIWMLRATGWRMTTYEGLVFTTGRVIGLVLVWMIFLISISARVKADNLLSYSVIGLLWKWIERFGGMLKEVICNLPLLWKSVLSAIVLVVIEALAWIYVEGRICHSTYDTCTLWLVIGLWIFEKLLLLPIFHKLLKLWELQEAAYELAEGNVNYKVDTLSMRGEIKRHGEYLNRISLGVGKAVNERMKSEHLKTELITNVSHDIKTPLTSIINYADLICKEETDNEKIKEYSDVLYRQSSRLKKLIEDLVEASKASTGNMEVNLQPCDVGVLLEQAAGEFAQRLYEKNVDLVSKQPESPVQIMADPKLLWRVFDNLMNNICKYSQNGTRVYLSVEQLSDKAVISFKNISEFPLDISAEELMERFVRGDRSRHTEGNGLGLNIARSLTELQNGTLELVIDGDLFKVLLSFPIKGDEAELSPKALIASEQNTMN